MRVLLHFIFLKKVLTTFFVNGILWMTIKVVNMQIKGVKLQKKDVKRVRGDTKNGREFRF